jgi:hypothetical protein
MPLVNPFAGIRREVMAPYTVWMFSYYDLLYYNIRTCIDLSEI